MPKKISVEVRSLGGGKYDVSVGSKNGLAVHDGNRWTLSPNLRGISEDTKDALLNHLNKALALVDKDELAESLVTLDHSMKDIREGRTQSAKPALKKIADEFGLKLVDGRNTISQD